jgi:glycosyltransferase involved in cell wall biosynthesis
MQPFFSIVVPTLNEELFLPYLLKDLQNQKEKNFEVIVVDSYSEDKTKFVVRNWNLFPI